MVYDLIIIGSGSVGSAAGFYATEAGLNVLMVDAAFPPHHAGSHHGETRIIRHAYGEGKKYVPLLLRAQTLWDELAIRSDTRLFHRSGVLNLGPHQSDFITNAISSSQAYQLDCDILNTAQITARWPEFTLPKDYLGVFEPQAGYLKSELAIANYIRLAEQAGCAQLFNCAVTAIERQGREFDIATLDGSHYQGHKLLISAGTWVKKLIPSLPITPVRKVFSWHQADGRFSEDNHFPAFTLETPDHSHYYGFPADKNALKIGKHDGGQPIDRAEQRTPFGSHPTDGSENFDFLRHFLPGVGVCLNGDSCTYDLSPDEDFIIDTLPDNPDMLIVSGLSGHGFKFASVLGEIAAGFAAGHRCAFDLAPFALSRFASLA
ncbi:N-methyl-L-tryptophan oxidase [Acerihabitans sp. TG2]|uniref:N-methyl-L-tryptophan oxidase n=1 Tax=Acerihabitans sp. TG2 TaxID=3096008 RepID=UPI002B23542F|nr:N-methyl-L-tryptophan oxidase [Acerihabitans sp. TG2]MEA9391974.1 N-methyl-L-tryptophan oxidase [Acerihabitans sp. TG2]